MFEKAGLLADLDEGCILLGGPKEAKAFIETCAQLRFWPRELEVDLDAVA